MPKSTTSFNPLRLFSPIQLFICFILFFLPWVELQCVLPKSRAKEMSKEEVELMKKQVGVDPTKPVSLISQSGLQIATGDVSLSSDMKRITDSLKKEMSPAGTSSGGEPDMKKNDDTGMAPLMFLYPLAILAGIGVAFIPIPALFRRLAVAACCMGALGVIALQALIGFPIESSIKKNSDQMKMMGSFTGAPPPAPAGEVPPPPNKKGKATPKTDKTDSKSDTEMIRVSWQIPLYLTFLLLLGGTATAFLDGLGGGGAASRYGKRYRRDEDDEDEDEEEDDRPRKKDKRASRDNDEEDDRPRKKKKYRDEEDEEDERPAKKKKYAEDEEDDERPVKKKKARAGDDDDEDDRPAKKKKKYEEDEDDRPVKKKSQAPAEPEFQMPAASPPPPAAPAAPAGGAPNPFAFDDEEPKPKKKARPRDDDDEDDRPRKKRRRDDDD